MITDLSKTASMTCNPVYLIGQAALACLITFCTGDRRLESLRYRQCLPRHAPIPLMRSTVMRTTAGGLGSGFSIKYRLPPSGPR